MKTDLLKRVRNKFPIIYKYDYYWLAFDNMVTTSIGRAKDTQNFYIKDHIGKKYWSLRIRSWIAK